MHKRLTDRDILVTLADRLPEQLLRDCFPGADTARIRQALRRLGGPAGPSPAGPAADLPGNNSRPPRLKPVTNRCILYTDGAARGNPGKAGAGMVLLDHEQREVAARSLYLGECTNNGAEYRALIAGLELALENGCRQVDIMMDSELIVRQLTGEYRVKNAGLQPLHRRVKDLLTRMDRWRVKHVPRVENARADQLANQGIDNHT